MDNKLYSKIFIWLFAGLLITFLGGYGLTLVYNNNLNFAKTLFTGPAFWIIIIIQVILAIALSARLSKMNSTMAKILYIVYCLLTSVTFSTLFMAFKLSSIMIIFLVTAIIFGLFAVIGAKLNVDLRKFGTYLFIGLIGVIIVEIINIFMGNTTLEMVICGASILIFTLYIGYDIKVAQSLADSGIDEDNLAVYTAFQLYLDFINLFIRLLQLFGDRRD